MCARAGTYFPFDFRKESASTLPPHYSQNAQKETRENAGAAYAR